MNAILIFDHDNTIIYSSTNKYGTIKRACEVIANKNRDFLGYQVISPDALPETTNLQLGENTEIVIIKIL